MKKAIGLAIVGLFVISLIGIVSAEDITGTSDNGVFTVTIKQVTALDSFIDALKNLFVIVLEKNSFQQGESILVKSQFEINYCLNTIVKIELLDSSGQQKDIWYKPVGKIEAASFSVTQDVSSTITTNLPVGTYTFKDTWSCYNTIISSTPSNLLNPSTKSFSLIAKTSTCVNNWQSGSWGICSSARTQTRTVTDLNNCPTQFNKPDINQLCNYQDHKVCYDGDVYWADDGNMINDKVTECGTQSCNNGVCGTSTGGNTQTCVGNEEIFYSNGYSEEYAFFKPDLKGLITSDVANKFDKFIPSFSNKYRDNKANACCQNLTYEFVQSINYEYAESLFDLGLDWDKVKISYDSYKCKEKKSGEFCIEVANKLLNNYTKADCQTNSIILLIIIVFAGVLAAKFAG